MNDGDRRELEELLIAQRSLRQQLTRLEVRLEALQQRMEQTETSGPVSVMPPVAPPPRPLVPENRPAVPPPLPILPRVPERPEPEPEELPKVSAPIPAPIPGKSRNESLELQIGKVWLVRIGVVILLTGLVFLGNYAYQNFIGTLGPGGKIGLLTLAGAGLLGLGMRLERRRAELVNYARVLLGGGLATLYYTVYAAHYVPRLQIIESPLVGGVLLLAIAGAGVWMADRRKSQTLAMIAILLSFYTSAINPLASFTLFSNLLLTAAAVWFLVRNQWTALSFASLAASYASYGFWRFFRGVEHGWYREEQQGFWLGLSFLLAYFVLFTAAAFLSKGGRFQTGRRLSFLSLNNAAFFLLGAAAFSGEKREWFWIFAVGLGALLLVLSILARRTHPEDLHMDGGYLSEGLVILTAGIVAKIGGYQLPVVLAAESALVLACAQQRHGWIFQAFSSLCAAGAFGLALEKIQFDPSLAPLLGTVLPLLFLFNARWSKHLCGERPEFSFRPATHVALALILAGRTLGLNLDGATEVVVFAGLGVALAYLIPLHGLIELASLAQGYVLWGAWLWADMEKGAPWWLGLATTGALLVLAEWWKQRELRMPDAGPVFQLLLSIAMSVVVWFWIERSLDLTPAWQPVLLGIALVSCLLYASVARMWPMFVAAQLLLAGMLFRYFWNAAWGHPHWGGMLVVLGLMILSAEIVHRFRLPFPDHAGTGVSPVYRWIAFAMYIAWGLEQIPSKHLFWFFIASALAIFAVGVLSKNKERLLFSALMAGSAFLLFWFGPAGEPTLGNFLAILAILAVQQVGKVRFGTLMPIRVQQILILLGAFTLWLHLTRWAGRSETSFVLSVTWAILAGALLAAGILFRERVYRWCGLVLVAVSLGRALFVDLWRLGTLAQFVSLLVLGAVLIAIGFLYNRFADRLKEWL